jgi:Zn-dependent protease with chaperone function
MTVVGAGLGLALAIALPHLLDLRRLTPRAAATVWLCALLLRAIAVLAVALGLEILVPTLPWLRPLASVCLAAPGRTISAHAIADLLLALPAFALAGSLALALLDLWRASLRVRRLMHDGAIGPGPAASVVIADRQPLLAAAGLRRPRVVVSAGALLALDDRELAAALAHEHGHIARGHRYLLVTAQLACALARGLPGTRTATRELVFELERDADHYALAHDHEPAVLASAICKAAGAALQAPLLGLGGSVVARRVRLLLGTEDAAHRRAHLGLVTLAPTMAALVVTSALAFPFLAHARFHEAHAPPAAAACDRAH